MQPESAKLLTDILEASQHIVEYVSGKTREVYLADRALRDAVQWNFLVIGEALGKLRKIDPQTAEQIAEWKQIIAFRNRLIHGYGTVEDEVTWEIIENKIPILLAEVQTHLGLP